MAVAAGCVPPYSVPNDSSYTDGGSSDADEDTTTSSSDESTSTGGTTSTSGADESSTTEPSPFIVRPDGGVRPYECDFWNDECPRGEKCMPWSPGGGFSLDGTTCAPIARDPNAIGEPCTRIDGPNGIDDCEAGSMCWGVDSRTNMGHCTAFCTGSEAQPICPDEALRCTFLGETFPSLCLSVCDPVVQDCAEGTGCYPWHESFRCFVDHSEDDGAPGDPCEYFSECDAGSFCAAADVVPGCSPPDGCCTPFCDLDVADPGCPDALECIAWYDEGAAPEGFESVGGCMEGG